MFFPPLAQTYKSNRPQGFSAPELFEHCVKYAAAQHLDLSPKTHASWANLLFPAESNFQNREHKMSQAKQAFSLYFTKDFQQYTFNVDLIVQNYPQWFKQKDIFPEANLFKNVENAVDQEIIQAQDVRNLKSYQVYHWDEYPYQSHYIYAANLLLRDDEDPHFREGMKIRVKNSSNTHVCEVIEYDYSEEILYFTSTYKLYFVSNATYIYVDNSFILEGLRNRVLHFSREGIPHDYPLYKFINGTTRNISSIDHEPIPEYISHGLDEPQKEAYDAALNKDVTFIWGPPGTGKSFTLAAIIMGLFQLKDERTIVCCVSNVAVDQLVNKVVDILLDDYTDIQPGNFYRAGHTTDERIISTDFLFPEDDKISELRQKIKDCKRELDELKEEKGEDAAKIIELKARIKDLRVSLHDRTDYLVQKSRVVFSTISNFVLSEKLRKSDFDNLIVDEASMLAMPSLLALAGRIDKRIILVGDFQQLSPISIVPNQVLRDNVFELCGIDIEHTTHPALHLLLNQRRSHEKIVELINGTYYNNQLQATHHRSNAIIETPPFEDRVITMVDVPESAVRFTKGGTRQNPSSAQVVIDILDQLSEFTDGNISIGIITPYRGQVNMIRALKNARNYPPKFDKQIRLGTVHTFQGSESDIIIFDIVDCEKQVNGKDANVGKIYGGKEGEQLLNVAISRARHKLIIVGDAGWFADRAPGNTLTSSTRQMMRKLNHSRIIQ